MLHLEGRRIAVTGGTGFVGGAIVNDLASRNEVRVLDLNVHGQAPPPEFAEANVEVLNGDVRDPEAVAQLVDGANVVIHLASLAGVRSTTARPAETMEIVLLGAHNVLQAARPLPDLERVVLFSTSEVAGRFAYKVTEEATFSGAGFGEIRWTYAAAKLASEFYAAATHVQYGVPTVHLRPFNIYGPGQLGSGAVREFVRAAVTGEPLTVRGDGSQIRAWCFIDDIVRAVELCCIREEAIGQGFNIGNPRSVITVSELARLVVRLAETSSPVVHEPTNEVDVELRVPDITRARQLLEFEPQVELEEGLLTTIAHFRGQPAHAGAQAAS